MQHRTIHMGKDCEHLQPSRNQPTKMASNITPKFTMQPSCAVFHPKRCLTSMHPLGSMTGTRIPQQNIVG